MVKAGLLVWSGRLDSIPADGGLIADLAAGVSASGITQAALAVAPGSMAELIGVVTPAGADAGRFASLLATMPAAVPANDAEAAWDHLAVIARAAKTMLADRQIIAAALTFRGRGRLIGPLDGDVLLRFGVSAWR